MLDALIRTLITRIRTFTTRLLSGGEVTDWQGQMRNALTDAFTRAYADGAGVKVTDLRPSEVARIARRVAAQERFLKGFASDIQNGRYTDHPDALAARALLYAPSVKAPWWAGATRGLALPAYPGDGTGTCKTRCRCAWDVQWLDQEKGDADCYWRLGGGGTESCQICIRRSQAWSPYKVRGGMKA